MPDGRIAGVYRLGQVDPTTQAIVATGYSTGTAIATPAAAAAVVPLVGASLAVPLVGAAFAAIFLGIRAIMNSGCGQTCIVSTEFANKAGDLMTQNLNAYLALPSPRSRTAQAAYLSNFDTFWAWLSQQCSNPALGDAGKRCISDRQAGACVFHAATPGGWNKNADGSWSYTPYGPAVSSGGVCWNWFIGLRDPIANDPAVVDDSIAADASTVFGSSGALLALLALVIGLVLL
jgi:hypothetical protein